MRDPKEGDLQVWHIPQIPGESFKIPVDNAMEAINILGVLAIYDQYQYQNGIKPDYTNAAGLEIYEDGEWCEWIGEGGEDITEFEEKTRETIAGDLIELNNIEF